MNKLTFIFGILVLLFIGFIVFRHFHHSETPTLSNTPYPTTQDESLPLACQTANIEELVKTARGHTISAHDPNIIYYNAQNSVDIVHTHQYNLVTKEDICLTCNNTPGKNPTGNNDGEAQIDPTGRYMSMVVEMDQHPGSHAIATAGQGWFLNIWGWDMSLNKWYNLTNYPQSVAPNYEIHGILLPRVSHDGKQIAWAELYKADLNLTRQYKAGTANTGALFGSWRVDVADINYTPDKIYLSNIRQFTPGNADYYELENWTADDSQIAVSSDIGQDSPLKSNIYLVDVKTGEFTPFTDNKNEWNEQVGFSDDGTKSVFMSSRDLGSYDPSNPKWQKTLASELYIANADGTNPIQITHFNTPGYPEYFPKGGIAAKADFSRDGKYLIFNSTDRGTGITNLYKLNFKGVCGGV